MILGDIVMYHPFFAPLLMFVCGVALAFHGRKLVPLALGLAAMALGFLHGGKLIILISDNPDILRWGPILVAILLTVLVMLLYRVAFFLAGVLLGYFLSGIMLPDASWLITAGIAVLSGALVYFFRNFVFSVLTALMGAALLSTGAVNLLGWAGVTAGRTVYLILFVVSAFLGAVSQLRKGRK